MAEICAQHPLQLLQMIKGLENWKRKCKEGDTKNPLISYLKPQERCTVD